MAARIVNYTVENYSNTKNNALWTLAADRAIRFSIDHRTYACEGYDLHAEFKNKKQLEKLFNKKFNLISPYDIIELCSSMVESEYNVQPNDSRIVIKGEYDFRKLDMDHHELNAHINNMFPYPGA